MILLRSVPIPKFMVAALAALALATGSMTPTQTRAGTEELLGAIVVIGAACAISGKCSGKNRKKGGRSAGARGGQGGYGDAVALNRQQARLIQEGLASQGYYTGAIDGALGKGSRQAIRTYQSATGAKVTGVLTGEQINTLAALSPSYAGLPPNSPALFEVDIARDTNRDELRTIQAGLNAKGYNAGPVDGSMGGKTRTAIAAYKADHGLPGAPIPSRRLIAHLENAAYPTLATPTPKPASPGGFGVAGAGAGAGAGAAAGLGAAAFAGGGDQGLALVETETLSVDDLRTPTEVVALTPDYEYEILGIKPGLPRNAVEAAAAEAMEGEIYIATGQAHQFGGIGALTLGHLITQESWPAPGSQQLASFYDQTAPGKGAVAIFRTILLPPDATEEDFRRETLPALIDFYGREGLVDGALTWIGNGKARGAARADAASLARCGSVALAGMPKKTAGADVSWDAAQAPILNISALATADCGQVMTVQYLDQSIRIGLWDSARLNIAPAAKDAVAGEGAKKLPKIKF